MFYYFKCSIICSVLESKFVEYFELNASRTDAARMRNTDTVLQVRFRADESARFRIRHDCYGIHIEFEFLCDRIALNNGLAFGWRQLKTVIAVIERDHSIIVRNSIGHC